jgi:hypothetical protein
MKSPLLMPESNLSFINQLTAGAVAGISEISVMYPLDGNFSDHLKL